MLYTCDVDMMQNNILKIPWCHWFSSPAFYISQNGLDTKKIFSVFIIHVWVHLRITGTSPNLDCLANDHFTVNMSQGWGIYSPQSCHFTNHYKTTTHLPNIAIFLYYYNIRHKLNVYQRQIQFLCLERWTTYWIIPPIVTKMVVLALHSFLYLTKVNILVNFWLLKPLHIFLIESDIFVISTSE